MLTSKQTVVENIEQEQKKTFNDMFTQSFRPSDSFVAEAAEDAYDISKFLLIKL